MRSCTYVAPLLTGRETHESFVVSCETMAAGLAPFASPATVTPVGKKSVQVDADRRGPAHRTAAQQGVLRVVLVDGLPEVRGRLGAGPVVALDEDLQFALRAVVRGDRRVADEIGAVIGQDVGREAEDRAAVALDRGAGRCGGEGQCRADRGRGGRQGDELLLHGGSFRSGACLGPRLSAGWPAG